jgi:hypothetical protein
MDAEDRYPVRQRSPSDPLKISLFCGSTVLERTLAASHTGDFFNLFRHLVGLLSTSDQSVAKISTYTGQHNTDGDKPPCLKRDSNP